MANKVDVKALKKFFIEHGHDEAVAILEKFILSEKKKSLDDIAIDIKDFARRNNLKFVDLVFLSNDQTRKVLVLEGSIDSVVKQMTYAKNETSNAGYAYAAFYAKKPNLSSQSEGRLEWEM